MSVYCFKKDLSFFRVVSHFSATLSHMSLLPPFRLAPAQGTAGPSASPNSVLITPRDRGISNYRPVQFPPIPARPPPLIPNAWELPPFWVSSPWGAPLAGVLSALAPQRRCYGPPVPLAGVSRSLRVPPFPPPPAPCAPPPPPPTLRPPTAPPPMPPRAPAFGNGWRPGPPSGPATDT